MTAYQIQPGRTDTIATTYDEAINNLYLEKKSFWQINTNKENTVVSLKMVSFVDTSFIVSIFLILANSVAIPFSLLGKINIHPALFINLLIMSLGITITIYIKNKRAKQRQEIYN